MSKYDALLMDSSRLFLGGYKYFFCLSLYLICYNVLCA